MLTQPIGLLQARGYGVGVFAGDAVSIQQHIVLSFVNSEIHRRVRFDGGVDQPRTAAAPSEPRRPNRRRLPVQMTKVEQNFVLHVVQAAEGNLRELAGHALELAATEERFATNIGDQVVAVGAAFGNQAGQRRANGSFGPMHFDGFEAIQRERLDLATRRFLNMAAGGR